MTFIVKDIGKVRKVEMCDPLGGIVKNVEMFELQGQISVKEGTIGTKVW